MEASEAPRADVHLADLSQIADRATRRKLVIAGLVGNVLEWYDFSIYGYFAATIGAHFFPSKNPTASLIAAFGVFSLGFLTRPLGAVLFGYIGDRYSRERALTLSILAMALPTFGTGLIPSAARIGVAAAVVMVILRLIQGLSAGGEYTTSIVFLVERASSRRGLMGSFGLFGSIAGGMLGSALGALVTRAVPQATLNAWAWRLPFLFGIAPAFVGIVIRQELARLLARREKRVRIAQVLLTQWRSVVKVFGFELLEAVGFYSTFIYLSTYLSNVLHVPEEKALAINTLCLAWVLIVIPLSAMLSDRIGRKPILLAAASAAALFVWPIFRLLHHPAIGIAALGQLCLATIIATYEGAAPAAAAEAFPTSVRNTGVGIAFNFCMTIFGGTTPMLATLLIAHYHSDMAPAVLLIVVAVISAMFAVSLRETADSPLAP